MKNEKQEGAGEDGHIRLRRGHTSLNRTLSITWKCSTGKSNYCGDEETVEHLTLTGASGADKFNSKTSSSVQ